MPTTHRQSKVAASPSSRQHLAFRLSSFVFRLSIPALCIFSSPIAHAQFDPDAPTTAPATQPHTLALVTPTVNTAQKQIELPVDFWNEHMTGWVETALSGLPSDFSHETIIAATITRSTLVDALHQAGFHDADAWVSNVQDFPRIRGDKALILLTVRRKDHTDSYLIDELLTFVGWNTSIGPYGWMFKGRPGETQVPTANVAATATANISTAATQTDPAPATEPVDKPSVAVQVLRDDPQIALQFRGIQHSSQSFIDHPTCYDNGVYPLPRFYRNTKVLSNDIFDSNGDVPAQMTIRKVTEEEFLVAAAKYWHDPAAASYMQKQIPIARQIDADKAELWKLIPAVRTLVEQSKQHPETVVLADSPLIARAGVLAASIEKGYAALDCAWATWAADHCQPDADAPADPDTNRSLKEESTLLRQHFENLRDRAAFLYEVQAANAAKSQLRLAGAATAQSKAEMRRLSGRAVEAKSRAQQAENVQVLAYWLRELSRLDPKDPREDWIRQIRVQVVLAQARQTAAQAGIAFGKALQADDAPNLPATQNAYQNALMQLTIANLQAQLADVEFEVRKRQEDKTDPDLPGYLKRRAQLQQQLTAAQATTQPSP